MQRSLTLLNKIHLPSPVSKLLLRDKPFYIKRDDTLHHELSGNKFRKLYQLIQTPPARYSKLISYGGSQSNAMLAMAYLAHQKKWRFEYYTKTIPLHVKQHPDGNYKKALDLGMHVIEVPHDQFEERICELFLHVNFHEVLVPQGGADPIAQSGIAVLADEIRAWKEEHEINKLNVITPSGTGTTAYYLAQLLPTCKVLTTAVIGDDTYLKTQMKALGDIPENLQLINTEKRYRFATPYREFYEIYQELLKSGIEFDLVYAPKMWLALLENMRTFEGDFLYVHSGGVSGNATMLKRYQFKEIL